MGNGCTLPGRNGEMKHSILSQKELEGLRRRIDVAIESLPLNYDELVPTEGFRSRREAIEHAMGKRGYRKITPLEYAIALQNQNLSIFIWVKTNSHCINEYENDSLSESVATEALVKMRTIHENDRDSKMIHVAGIQSASLENKSKRGYSQDEIETLVSNDVVCESIKANLYGSPVR